MTILHPILFSTKIKTRPALTPEFQREGDILYVGSTRDKSQHLRVLRGSPRQQEGVKEEDEEFTLRASTPEKS